ncbi:hypothetical protein H206_03256 [Candidatus Electrothrix aarhusensis]|jgi:hypothetical protein|uniref:Uncharacterized protein n=1 Tax=Candidatus Electrothrix aarhusensis TaxID=1859131 RepID=A0A444IQB8_9BACT|nr:hypothetical protein H206_03256 [Candidatus Electrothrix aarhusensis]
MKTKKDMRMKAVAKKSVKKKSMPVKTQLKAGSFGDGMKTVYAPNGRMRLPV